MNQYRERVKREAAKRRAMILRLIDKKTSLSEIGKLLGISKQRVGQLAAKGREE